MNFPSIKTVTSAIDRFWMSPGDLRILIVLRPLFGMLLLINLLFLWPDRGLFFTSDGVVSDALYNDFTAAEEWGGFSLIERSLPSVTAYFLTLVGFVVCLTVGFFPRLSALMTFVLLTGLYHSNWGIFDSEDILFRTFAFFFIFVPPAEQLRRAKPSEPEQTSETLPVWPLRMFQLQMCFIFFCSALQKLKGEAWLDGTAVYYLFRMSYFPRFALPDFITENLLVLQTITWGVMAFELLVPFLVWFRATRLPAIALIVAFHLVMDWSLNLFLFHWLMILGWTTFLTGDDFGRMRDFAVRLVQKKPTVLATE